MTVSTPTPAEVVATIRKAAEEMELRGLCRESYTDEQGRVCAIGALQVAVYGHAFEKGSFGSGKWTPLYLGAKNALDDLVAEISDRRAYFIDVYNDIEAVDTADMVRVMRAAADEYERTAVSP